MSEMTDKQKYEFSEKELSSLHPPHTEACKDAEIIEAVNRVVQNTVNEKDKSKSGYPAENNLKFKHFNYPPSFTNDEVKYFKDVAEKQCPEFMQGTARLDWVEGALNMAHHLTKQDAPVSAHTDAWFEVPCSERLPEKQDIYFTIKNNGRKGTALRTDDNCYYDGKKRPLMDSDNMYDKTTVIWLEKRPVRPVAAAPDAVGLLREVVMRGQLCFPENEQDLKWFEEEFKKQHSLFVKVNEVLGLGISPVGEARVLTDKEVKETMEKYKKALANIPKSIRFPHH